MIKTDKTSSNPNLQSLQFLKAPKREKHNPGLPARLDLEAGLCWPLEVF